MKKLSLLLLVLFFALAASGGYGYFLLQNDSEEDDSDEPVSSSGNYPKAKMTPTNPKIQINDNISFSASESTDPDGDDLTFLWSFEGDSKEYEGSTINRNFPDKGEYMVFLKVTDSTGLSDETDTTVLVVEDHNQNESGQVNGQTQYDEFFIPVENGFVSLDIDYDLDADASSDGTDATVTLRLTDADGVVVEEEEITCQSLGQQNCDGNWGYSSDDLSSTGDYVFSITREEGTMNWDAAIVVKY